jgi:multimeric flavodoxin WrbA
MCRTSLFCIVMRKILVLDGSGTDDVVTQTVGGLLCQEMDAEHLTYEYAELRTKRIAPCTGCFGCWVRSPGVCVIKDDVQDLMRSWMSSTIVVLLTRITFGGYSSLLKRALDRQIGLVNPYFISKDGSVNHAARYEHYPNLLVIGVCDELRQREVDVFKQLVRQDGITLHALSSRPLVLCSGEMAQSMKAKLNTALMGMKVGQ